MALSMRRVETVRAAEKRKVEGSGEATSSVDQGDRSATPEHRAVLSARYHPLSWRSQQKAFGCGGVLSSLTTQPKTRRQAQQMLMEEILNVVLWNGEDEPEYLSEEGEDEDDDSEAIFASYCRKIELEKVEKERQKRLLEEKKGRTGEASRDSGGSEGEETSNGSSDTSSSATLTTTFTSISAAFGESSASTATTMEEREFSVSSLRMSSMLRITTPKREKSNKHAAEVVSTASVDLNMRSYSMERAFQGLMNADEEDNEDYGMSSMDHRSATVDSDSFPSSGYGTQSSSQSSSITASTAMKADEEDDFFGDGTF